MQALKKNKGKFIFYCPFFIVHFQRVAIFKEKDIQKNNKDCFM